MGISDDVRLAEVLAETARAAIRPFYRARFASELKPDASPVTEADRAAEAAIRAILERERPGDGIIGEEYGPDRPDAERIWVLDPIDGTRSFVAGRPIFGTLIALIEGDAPVLGVIDQPIAGERWIGAKGSPTTLNGVLARTRRCEVLRKALFATTAPWFAPRFDALRAAAADTLLGGDCYNYALLASGHVDLVVEAGLKLYDFAALVPIVEGAGGRMTDLAGAPLTRSSDGGVIAAGDPALVGEVVELLS